MKMTWMRQMMESAQGVSTRTEVRRVVLIGHLQVGLQL
jgi:hypothetical protein